MNELANTLKKMNALRGSTRSGGFAAGGAVIRFRQQGEAIRLGHPLYASRRSCLSNHTQIDFVSKHTF